MFFLCFRVLLPDQREWRWVGCAARLHIGWTAAVGGGGSKVRSGGCQHTDTLYLDLKFTQMAMCAFFLLECLDELLSDAVVPLIFKILFLSPSLYSFSLTVSPVIKRLICSSRSLSVTLSSQQLSFMSRNISSPTLLVLMNEQMVA